MYEYWINGGRWPSPWHSPLNTRTNGLNGGYFSAETHQWWPICFALWFSLGDVFSCVLLKAAVKHFQINLIVIFPFIWAHREKTNSEFARLFKVHVLHHGRGNIAESFSYNVRGKNDLKKKRERKEIRDMSHFWFATKCYGFFPLHAPSLQFHGNPFSRFCIILVTNKPADQPPDVDETIASVV